MWLFVDHGHETADARLRAYRLTGRAGRLDFGEIPRLERLQGRPRRPLFARRPPDQHHALLDNRCHWVELLALLRAFSRAMDRPLRTQGYGANRVRRAST